jgi:hypothetical protein
MLGRFSEETPYGRAAAAEGREKSVLLFLQSGITFCFVKTLTVKLPEPLFSEISHTAKVRKVAKSVIVRERLEKPVSLAASLWSRMEDVVMSTDTLPVDLSTHKSYFADYGKNRADR